mgnify:CR=1 FL=1
MEQSLACWEANLLEQEDDQIARMEQLKLWWLDLKDKSVMMEQHVKEVAKRESVVTAREEAILATEREVETLWKWVADLEAASRGTALHLRGPGAPTNIHDTAASSNRVAGEETSSIDPLQLVA